jgi:PilZ domain
MTSSLSDRRSTPRYPLGAKLMFTSAGQLYPGHVQDLGKGGLSFWAEVDLPVGESLTLTLTLIVGNAQATLTSRGLIRWKQTPEPGRFHYGTLFCDLNPAQFNVLAEFLGGTGQPPVADTQ